MNDVEPPPVPVDPKKADKRRIWAGFLTGLALAASPFVVTVFTNGGFEGAMLVSAGFNLLVFPVIAILLAIIPATRKFGLGLLLACGLALLVSFAICGGIAVYTSVSARPH